MKRRGRSILGAVGGVLWGAGAAVLIQQYGLWPLDPALAYGAPLAGSISSSLWGRRGSQRTRRTAATAMLAMIPLAMFAFQQPTCGVYLETDSNSGMLEDTSPGSPFLVDPATDDVIDVDLLTDDTVDGTPGEIWIEFGGIRSFGNHGEVSGSLEHTFDLTGNGYADLGGAPGIYHVGGSIEGVCAADGYIRIQGNPLTAPVGQGGAGAVGLGLLLTWFAGRPGKAPTSVPARRSSRLLPGGEPLRLDGALVRSPGLTGEATAHPPSEAVIRAVAGWTEDTRTALAHHHLKPERVIELSDATEVEVQAPITTHHGEAAFRIELPTPGAEQGQIILASDEGGVAAWHLPRLGNGNIDTQRLGASCMYRIRRRIAPGDEQDRTRGLITAVGSKVLTSLVFPLLDPVFGEVGERFARSWESKRRPYRFRSFTPEDYDLESATEPDWDALARGKALLFIHGTFSRAHTGFGDLPVGAVEDLHELYDGRVFAFDHFTLSDDPRRNIKWFLENVPDGIRLNLDIVCHSRGGLVSRVLAEKQGGIGTGDPLVDVEKIVFAASPNAGTILTEPAYVGDFVDSYTNLLNFVPGHHVADVLEGVVTAIKQIAVGAVAGLAGLQAMRPSGEFLRWLNTPATNQARYFAVTGDYEPQIRGWRDYAANRLMDRIFREPNDLVVPTGGTYANNGSSHFPIENPLIFREEDGINHTGYFGNKTLRDRLLEWLGSE